MFADNEAFIDLIVDVKSRPAMTVPGPGGRIVRQTEDETTDDEYVPAEFESIQSFSDFFEMAVGFVNGTAVLSGPSFTSCEEKIVEYQTHIEAMVTIYTDEIEAWLLTLDWDNSDTF